MQLEQQESFTIHGPQLEILGEVETKLPAPVKKRPVAAGVLYPALGLLLNPMIAAACMSLSSVCVVSNALMLKANFPEMEITVDSRCCAGVTPETHAAALTTMACCQINVK